jgi:hypothetical protein
MDLSFRDMDWLKSKLGTSGVVSKNYVKVQAVEQGYTVSYDGAALGTIVETPEGYAFAPTETYNNWQPANAYNDQRYPENRLRNLLDTLFLYWALEEKSSSSLFRLTNGELSNKSVKAFRERVKPENYNGLAHFLTRKFMSLSVVDKDAVFPDWSRYFERAQDSAYAPTVLVHTLSIEGEDYRMVVWKDMTGYRFHSPSQSWWPAYQFNDEGHPTEWLRRQPVSCSCGEQVARDQLIGNKCAKCIGIPKEKLVIHSYSMRAPTLLPFKGKSQGKRLPEKFSKYYSQYLNQLGLSIPNIEEDSPLYLGLELEYECDDVDQAMIETLTYLKDHAILKSDGSIRDGFEIVTCPATYEEQVAAMKPFFDNFSKKMHAKSNCGLHMHISRKPLSLLTQGKLIEFMNREDNKEFLTKIAGRWSSQYANNDPSRKVGYILRGGGGQRYNALNTNNKDTLEFRIFKGCENWQEFIPKLQFVVALAEYCKPAVANAPIKEATHHKEFVKWLESRRREYPELHGLFFTPKKPSTVPTKAHQVPVDNIPF